MDCKSRSCILSTGRWTLIYIVLHFVSLVPWTLKSFEIPFPFRYFTTKSKLDGSALNRKTSSLLHFTAAGMPSNSQHGSQISIVEFDGPSWMVSSRVLIGKILQAAQVAVIPRYPWNSPIIRNFSSCPCPSRTDLTCTILQTRFLSCLVSLGALTCFSIKLRLQPHLAGIHHTVKLIS